MNLTYRLLAILASVLAPGILTNHAALAETIAKDSVSAIADSCITRKEIISAQKAWGDGIVLIGKAYTNEEDHKALAANLVAQLYDYEESTVLFKPTKASAREFRLTEEEAVSYFVTGVVPEDHGFAIQPWSQVRFENADMILNCDSALTMGNYYFTDTNTGEEVKVDYTFGYRQDEDGKLYINLHHSSFPYQVAN